MDITTVAVGIFFVVAGLFFFVRSLRHERPAGKLKAMMERWGASPGLWMYRVAYVGVPLLFGTTAIVAGIRGVGLAAFLGR
jgi:hypothetical protein